MPPNSPFEQYFDTDYVPTPTQITEIRKVIDRHQIIVDGIDTRIEELDRLRKGLEEERKVHSKLIARHHNLTSVVRGVPTDVLTTIFLTLISNCEPGTKPRSSIALSHVCHQWRRLALGMPLLWRHIEISTPITGANQVVTKDLWMTHLTSSSERAKAFSDRAGNYPLFARLTIHDPMDDDIGQGVLEEMDTLKSASERAVIALAGLEKGGDVYCESLHFCLEVNPSTPLSMGFLGFVQIPVRYLAVEITYLRSGSFRRDLLETLRGTLDLREASSLAGLTFRMRYMNMLLFTVNWDALTDLTLGPDCGPGALLTPNHIITFMSKATNLERFTFEFTHPDTDYAGIPPPTYPQIHLHRLKSLTIQGNRLPVSFVDSLNIPCLSHLSVTPRDGFSPRSDQSSALVALIRKYGHQLIEVSFNYQTVDSAALLSILRLIPNVQVLELSTFDRPIILAEGFPVLDSVIKRLIPASTLESHDDDRVGQVLCPRLQMFRFNLHEATAEVKEDIINLIQSRRDGRREGTVCWLDEVKVRFTKGSVQGMMDDIQKRGVRTSFLHLSAHDG
ncbi:hypothetical protein NMY22_g13015 [Coprinellus aureogranulatus]|nr:hypothetical protein NMY22_g13015 [Coprinellus aureogranulatus]